MPQFKKFIITQDKSVCDKLIANGFNLLSDICGTYTLANIENSNVIYTGDLNVAHEEIDIKKLVYTDKLTF